MSDVAAPPQGNPASSAAPVPPTAPGQAPQQKILTELKVSAHLMTLDPGLFCIVQTPGTQRPDDRSGLPGVRVSLPPGAASRPQAVTISAFRDDGWLSGSSDAALVRIAEAPAQILVTIYQAANEPEAAPRLQVLRLAGEGTAAPNGQAGQVGQAPAQAAAVAQQVAKDADIVAHIRMRGDVGAKLGEWIGERGSERWIEGFMIGPHALIAPRDIEYQGVLGRGWLSPWVEGGQLCGSRGMALPLLGLRLRLRGEAAEKFDLSYSASFIDGTQIGPVGPGEACESEGMAPLEAFQVTLTPRARAKGGEPKLAREATPAPEKKLTRPAARGAGKAGPSRKR